MQRNGIISNGATRLIGRLLIGGNPILIKSYQTFVPGTQSLGLMKRNAMTSIGIQTKLQLIRNYDRLESVYEKCEKMHQKSNNIFL
jgi:hypothetical protein